MIAPDRNLFSGGIWRFPDYPTNCDGLTFVIFLRLSFVSLGFHSHTATIHVVRMKTGETCGEYGPHFINFLSFELNRYFRACPGQIGRGTKGSINQSNGEASFSENLAAGMISPGVSF
jgi:hypothetical protein